MFSNMCVGVAISLVTNRISTPAIGVQDGRIIIRFSLSRRFLDHFTCKVKPSYFRYKDKRFFSPKKVRLCLYFS